MSTSFVGHHGTPPPVETHVTESRLPPLPNPELPTTTQHESLDQDRHMPVTPSAQRLDMVTLDSRFSQDRMPFEPRLPIVLPRFQDVRLADPRLPEPRYPEQHHIFATTHPLPYPSSSSNLAILEESRAITTLALPVTHHGSYPMITAHNILNTATTLASSPYLGSSPPSVIPSSFLYPPLYSTSPQYQTSLYLPSGEVRTYEILGQRATDIPMRVERPLNLSPTRLSIDSHAHSLREEAEHARSDQTRDTVQPMDTTETRRQSPRISGHAAASSESGSVWRPY